MARLFDKGYKKEENYDFLRKAEKLFAEAIKNSIGGASLKSIDEALTLYKNLAVEEDAEVVKQELAEARFSIEETADGTDYVHIDTDQDIFNGKKISDYPKIAKQYIIEHFKGKEFPLSDNEIALIKKRSAEKYAYSGVVGSEAVKIKMRAATELDNLIKIAKLKSVAVDDKGHSFAKNGFAYYETKFEIDGKMFSGVLNIALSEKSKMLYDLNQIKIEQGSNSENNSASGLEPNSTNNIRDSAENVNPKNENNRFFLKDNETNYLRSKGQVAKYVAEHSKTVAYNRTDAGRIITHILENIGIDDKTINIDGKTREQVTNILWEALNTKPEGYRYGTGEQIAEIIIKNAVMEDIFADKDFSADKHILGVLKEYIHAVDLTGIKDEIKARYDTDNSPYNLWGKRKGIKGQTPNQIAQSLAEIGIRFTGLSEADIFFELDDMYRNALNSMKKEAKKRLA